MIRLPAPHRIIFSCICIAWLVVFPGCEFEIFDPLEPNSPVTPDEFDWVWQNPQPIGNDLHDVVFLSEDVGIVVGEYGTILKTTDNGANWVIIESNTKENLNSVFFLDDFIGTAAGSRGTILRTTDSGDTWEIQNSGTLDGLHGVSFTTELVGVSVGENGTILKTSNGGETWKDITSGTAIDILDVTIYSPNKLFAVGRNGLALVSFDSGETWHDLPDQGDSDYFSAYAIKDVGEEDFFGLIVGSSGLFSWYEYGTYINTDTGVSGDLLDVTFLQSGLGFAVGEGGAIVSTNNFGWDSEPWTQLTSNTSNNLQAIWFSTPEKGVTVGDHGTILHTDNGGSTWYSKNSVSEADLLGVSFISPSIGTSVGRGGVILKTTDGGQEWTEQNSGTTQDLLDVFLVDQFYGTAVGSSGTILHTVDGGQTWIVQNSQTTIELRSVFFTNTSTGIVVGHSGTILRTTDQGNSWELMDPGVSSYLPLCDVFFSDSLNGCAVGGDIVLFTSDGGITWDDRSPYSMTLGFISVSFSDNNHGTIVGLKGFDEDNNLEVTIFRTTDGGLSWTVPDILAFADLFCVSFSNSQDGIIVGEDGAVFTTNDGGAKWTALRIGTDLDLNSVTLLDSNSGFISGNSGALFGKTNVDSQ